MHLHIDANTNNYVLCGIGYLYWMPQELREVGNDQYGHIMLKDLFLTARYLPTLSLICEVAFRLWITRKTRALEYFHPRLYTTSPQPKWPRKPSIR